MNKLNFAIHVAVVSHCYRVPLGTRLLLDAPRVWLVPLLCAYPLHQASSQMNPLLVPDVEKQALAEGDSPQLSCLV